MNKKKTTIITVMLVVLSIMAIGYSYFATRLNINATGSIDSTWNVYFSKIEVGDKSTGASTKSTPSVSNTTANMDVSLKAPGDYINFNITLVNGGSVDAIIEDIEAIAEGTPAIIFSISGIKIGDKLSGGNNTSKVITIKMEYDSSTTSQPSELTKRLTVNIDAVQDIGQSITVKDPIVTSKLSSKILSSNIAYATNTSSPNVEASTGINYGQPGGTTNGEGLYMANDDDGVSYFFRGNAVNNYVEIVGMELTPGWYLYHDNYASGDDVYTTNIRFDSEEDCQESGYYSHLEYQNDVWCEYIDTTTEHESKWRIIRINGDGTIRLAYEGDYFDEVDQTTPKMWYEANLKPFESLIADGVFCNDEEIYDLINPEGEVYDTGYKIFDRLGESSQPQLTCKSEYRINEKMWLVSADEAVMSGAVFAGSGVGSYLGDYYKLSSIYGGDGEEANGMAVDSETGWRIYGSGYRWFRPVINLISTVTATGSGTETDPYVILID